MPFYQSTMLWLPPNGCGQHLTWPAFGLQYGKLVFWTSKAAALSARRRHGFESPRKQEEDVEEGTDIAVEVWEADGESAQSQVRNAEVWEAATREVSKELVARSQESWRVWKVPSRNPFHRLRLPRWLTRGTMLTSFMRTSCT